MLQKLKFEVLNKNGTAKDKVALSDCVKEWFQKPFDKSLRLSNWASHELSPKQIEYAALDAWVLIDLYEAIQNDTRYKTSIQQAVGLAKSNSSGSEDQFNRIIPIEY